MYKPTSPTKETNERDRLIESLSMNQIPLQVIDDEDGARWCVVDLKQTQLIQSAVEVNKQRIQSTVEVNKQSVRSAHLQCKLKKCLVPNIEPYRTYRSTSSAKVDLHRPQSIKSKSTSI